MSSLTPPKDLLTELNTLFKVYYEEFKPLEALVIVRTNQFPVQTLNEIRNCFDHISRTYLPDLGESDRIGTIQKALGHIMRATLDCHKIILMNYGDRVKAFSDKYKNTDLSVVNNGRFLPEFERLVSIAEQSAIHARLMEAKVHVKEDSYPAYQQALKEYGNVEQYIADNAEGLANAVQRGRKRNRREWMFMVGGALLSVALGFAVSYFMQ